MKVALSLGPRPLILFTSPVPLPSLWLLKKMMVVLLITEDLSLLEDLPYTSDGVSWAAGTCFFCGTVMSTPTDLAIRGEATDNVVRCREGRRSQ